MVGILFEVVNLKFVIFVDIVYFWFLWFRHVFLAKCL